MHTRRLSFREAVAWLSGQDIGTFAPSARPQQHSDDNRNGRLAGKIWRESCLPEGTIVEDYLRGRRLELPDEPVIRFHPECPNGKDRMPAMVALTSDAETGGPRGIRRTFLRPDGSGKVSKMMLGPAGVIRLCEPVTNGLGIAEGIKTALAVAQRVGWGPVWATGSAGGIAKFPVLPQTTLNIFCDHDESSAGLRNREPPPGAPKMPP
jgi:putative DNA primase/helicase